MNNQMQMLQNILEALMTISTKGNDTITMANVLQALQNVIIEVKKMHEPAPTVVEPEVVENK